jgi:hypothetical protein
MTYHNTKAAMLAAFLNNSAGDTYSQKRLVTRETDAGKTALVAYGWLKLATYHPENGTVTVFTGHRSIGSQTVTRYLNNVTEAAKSDGKRVVLSGESPTVDTPNEGVKYIGNYVDMNGSHSAVERDAVDDVVESIDA